LSVLLAAWGVQLTERLWTTLRGPVDWAGPSDICPITAMWDNTADGIA
jgi:hypothetical protein